MTFTLSIQLRDGDKTKLAELLQQLADDFTEEGVAHRGTIHDGTDVIGEYVLLL